MMIIDSVMVIAIVPLMVVMIDKYCDDDDDDDNDSHLDIDS